MHTLASSEVKYFPQERNIQLGYLFKKAPQRQRTQIFATHQDQNVFCRSFTLRFNLSRDSKILTIIRCCHHIQPPSLAVRVDFAMVGIVSKHSPSLISLLTKTKTTQVLSRVIQLQITLVMLASFSLKTVRILEHWIIIPLYFSRQQRLLFIYCDERKIKLLVNVFMKISKHYGGNF